MDWTYAPGTNPTHTDGLPADWLRRIREPGPWLAHFQTYLRDVFRGRANPAYDWSETIDAMSGEADACGDLDPDDKKMAPYQAVCERLAMTARLDGGRASSPSTASGRERR